MKTDANTDNILDAPDSLLDDFDDSTGSIEMEPKSSFEAEIAILRAQIELNHVIARRGATGFVDGDTNLAREAIGRAVGKVAHLPRMQPRDRQLHAEAHFWNFLIQYYSDEIAEAVDALAVALQWRADLSLGDERDALAEWAGYATLPPCPRRANGYAAGAKNEAVTEDSDSESEDEKAKKKRKRKERRNRRAKETPEERTERRKRCKEKRQAGKDRKEQEEKG